MRVLEKKKIKGSLPLRIAVLCLVVYAAVSLVNQQIQINQKKEELRDSIDATEQDGSEYVERVAREELDYAKTGERVFIIISGE